MWSTNSEYVAKSTHWSDEHEAALACANHGNGDRSKRRMSFVMTAAMDADWRWKETVMLLLVLILRKGVIEKVSVGECLGASVSAQCRESEKNVRYAEAYGSRIQLHQTYLCMVQ
mmetsp:Transcript_24439/g.36471  ORF Transcript_24439/g.36471 Transcript_24439/m.36471 type:complete len:115 (-) Transcript_24439:815-1159(-)